MKKITLFFFLAFLAFSANVTAQTDYYTALVNNNGTSQNGRAPQAFDRCDRSVWLISATDMAAAGYVNGDVITSIGFTYTGTPSDVPTSGTFKVYLQNTTATTNTKSTTWSTAISGMTLASNNTITVPAALGSVDYDFSGGTAFTYTGGGLYIATDYQNLAGTLATVANTASCNASLAGGLLGARTTTTTLPTTLTASAYRPETRLGKLVPCARPLNVAVPSTTLNSANISFTSSNPVNFEYGPYDYTLGTGTTVSGVSSVYTLNGLTPSTAYEVYTKSDCGAFVGTSAWTVPVSFHTTFQPANPTYNTSFEVDDFPNMGWVADPEVNGSDWFINYGGTGSALVQNGLYSAISLANGTADASAMLYSRGVNLTAGSVVTVSYYDRVYLSATAPAVTTSSYVLSYGNDQTQLAQTTVLATVPSAANTAFALKTYTFTPATTGVYYFSFQNTTAVNSTAATTTEALIIDNFTVTQTLANNEVLESKFSTYPNPAKNVINVANTTDALITAIEMTDINGRVVKTVKFSNVSEAQVTVSDLAQGVYMMKIVSDKGIATKKVVKE